MQCVDLVNGYVVASSVPNGDMNQCAFVLSTPAELNSVKLQPFSMDSDSAIQISVAIILVWSVAWVFKQIGRVIKQ